MKKILFVFLFFCFISAYAESVQIIHKAISSVNSENEAVFKVNAINSYLIDRLIFHYKSASDNDKNWSSIEMKPVNGRFEAVISFEEVEKYKKTGFVYYIDYIDLDGKRKDGFADKENPQFVLVKGEGKKNELTKEDDEYVQEYKNDESEVNLVDELKTFVDEDIFNAKRVTLASGKEESIIGTPFSVTVITKKEIESYGATSIAEIFRLVPGMIVREQTAGNYDVHIRGFDNVPPNGFSTMATNMLTLLMINNRVVYDYQLGGIFWDALPIDVHDIERIEIVRGPASAIYGPSAASGVINIITKKVSQKNKYLGWVNIARGNNESAFLQGIAGYYQEINGKRKLGIVVSGNFQNRGRFNRKIWSWTQNPNEPGKGEYVEPEEINSINSNYKNLPPNLFVAVQYPYPETGVKRRGFNANVTYDLNNDISLKVDAGAQDSIALKPYQETLDSFLLTHESRTQYINAKLKLWKLNTRVSYTWGEQPIKGQIAMSGDIGIFSTVMDYGTKLFNFWDIKAIMNYNNIQYGALAYGGEEYKIAKFENLGLSLRNEINLFNKSLKFVGAGRFDMFAHLKNKYFTFQLASIYNYKDTFVLRGVYSRANRNPFLGPSYYQVRNLDSSRPTIYQGNKNLKLVTIDLMEVGSRFKINDNFDFDLEIFYTTGKNFSHFVPTGEIVVIDGVSRAQVLWSQLNLTAKQYGITFSSNFSLKKLRTKFFITMQKTLLDNYNEDWFNKKTEHLNDSGKEIIHTDTPKIYGGGYVNIGKFYNMNLNISTYYFTAQTYHHLYDDFNISSKILLNAKLSYSVTNRSVFYLNLRNILNDKSREFGFADETGALYILGFNAKF